MSSVNLCSLLRSREYPHRPFYTSAAAQPPFPWDTVALDPGFGVSPERLIRSHVSFPRRLHLKRSLRGHGGCVNAVEWNENGRLLVSGSDDTTLKIWDAARDYQLLHTVSPGHTRNVFCCTFVPGSNDEQLISVGADGTICHSHVDDCVPNRTIDSVLWIVFNLCFVPGTRSTFVTANESGYVSRYDLRESPCSRTEIARFRGDCAARGLAFDPMRPYYFAVGSQPRSGQSRGPLTTEQLGVRLFDMRMLAGEENSTGHVSTFMDPRQLDPACAPRRNHGATGLSINEFGELVVTFGGADVCLFDTRQAVKENNNVVQRYIGSVNMDTFLKDVSFFMDDYVTTGADCGHIYIWEKRSGKLVQYVRGDEHVVNGVYPSRNGLPIMASCGIDSTVKIWECGEEIGSGAAYKLRRKLRMKVWDSGEGPDDWQEPSGDAMDIEGYDWRQHEREAEDSQNIYAANKALYDVRESQSCLDEAAVKKEEGNERFRARDWSGARRLYNSARAMLKYHAPSHSHECKRLRLVLQLKLNAAMCDIKEEQWKSAMMLSAEVLKADPANVKAMFRCAKAAIEIGAFSDAIQLLSRAAELSPSDRQVRALLRVAHEREASYENSLRSTYRAMFSDE